MTIDEKKVLIALEKRQEYILANMESMTMKALRRVLEQDLQLEQGALRPLKKIVSGFVDTLLMKARTGEQIEESIDEKKNCNQSRKPNEEKKGRELSDMFIKMRKVCKQATIAIPPSVYRKNCDSGDMESAMLELLKRNGLKLNSSKSAIMAVKEKLQMERDLDGIDTSNIIDDGRRSRRKAVRYLEENDVSEEDRVGDSSSDMGSDTEASLSSNDDVGQSPLPNTVGAKRPKLDEWSDED